MKKGLNYNISMRYFGEFPLSVMIIHRFRVNLIVHCVGGNPCPLPVAVFSMKGTKTIQSDGNYDLRY